VNDVGARERDAAVHPATSHHVENVRIVLADDHAVVRDGIRMLLDGELGLSVVGEAADAEEAMRRARELQPDVLVLDLSMPGSRCAEVATQVHRECPAVRVLALTMHEERGYLAKVLRAGVQGYVTKRSAVSELVRAIRAVANGTTYVDPTLALPLFPGARTSRSAGRCRPSVRPTATDPTPREVEVLKLVARGYGNKAIAGALEISVKTVETHKANAMGKLGLESRAALVRYALDEGWLRQR
jgi:DNA-binding NarL/FixJ family response regulator